MARDKSKEYRITVNVQSIMSSTSNVTKAVYDRELRTLKKLVASVADTSVASGKIEVVDRDEFTTVTYTATFETHMIQVASITCKPGFELKDRTKFLQKRRGGGNEKSQPGQ